MFQSLVCLTCSTAALVSLALGSAAGYEWRNVKIGGGGYVTGIEYHPAIKGLAYARTDVGGAYRRDRPDGPWIPLNDAIGGQNNDFMQLGVLSLALDPSDESRVYLACGQYTEWWAPKARFMISDDRGSTWRSVELPFLLGGNIGGRGTGERLAVDPRNGRSLFLGTSQDGLWRSHDGGGHWSRVEGFSPAAVTFVRYDPWQAGTLYAAAAQTRGGSLWRSTDGGETWTAVPGQPEGVMALQGSFGPNRVFYLAFADSISPDAVKTGAVWKWNPDGTWKDLQVPAGQGGFAAVSASATAPGRVVVSTLARWWPRDEIYLTDNDGENWQPVLAEAALDLRSAPWAESLKPHWITDIEIDPFDPGRVSFVTGYGIFTTNRVDVAGKTRWFFDNDGLEETVPLALVSPASGPPLVSVIMDFDGFRHDDLGKSPRTRHAPMHGSNQSLDGAGAAPAVMARIHGNSGSISRDGGSTWKSFSSAPPAAEGGQIAVSADGRRLVWCPRNGSPHVSSDHGATWKPAAGCPAGNLWPAADRVEPLRFFVLDPGTKRIFQSRDGGATFRRMPGELPEGGRRVETVPGHAGHLWYAAGNAGLWRSHNAGVRFQHVAGLERAYHVGFGRSAPGASYPAIFLWGRMNGADGFFRSDDAGTSWLRINRDHQQFGFINDLTGDPRVFGRVFLGTSGRGVIMGEPARSAE